MASNVAVKVTADVVDLQAKFAVAKASSSALTGELNKLARQAASGNVGTELKGQLTQAAEAAAVAQAKVKSLSAEMKHATQIAGESPNAMRHTLQGLINPIRGIYNSVGALAEAFAAAFAVEQVVEFTNKITEAAAHIYHEAEVLGLTTDAYQAYAQSARLAGVAQSDAETAIRRFSVAQGMAQEGLKEQAEAFLDLNVSASQPVEDALPKVAKALLNMKDAAQAARIEEYLFGRGGLEIRPALEAWAAGTGELTARMRELGLVQRSDVAQSAEDARIAMDTAWQQMEVKITPAVVRLDGALATLASKWEDVVQVVREAVKLQTFGLVDVAPPLPKPPPAPKVPHLTAAQTEASEIGNLDSIDAKLQQRKELTKEIAVAQQALNDATKLGDTAGIEKANLALRDLKKELDGLNHQKFGGGFANAGAKAMAEAREQISQINENYQAGAQARAAADEKVLQELLKNTKLNAAQRLEVEKELNQTIAAANRATAQEMDQEARSDAARDVALAKTALEEKKQNLADELANHQITARQKYDATVQALQAEAAAEAAAQQQIIDSAQTSVVQKHEAANQIVEIDAQMNAQMASAARQLTAELKAEDAKREASYRAMVNEITGAEGELVSDVFTKRQGLLLDLEEIGARMLQSEIANDIKAMTEHQAVNLGILASDKATAQEGLLFKLGSYLFDKTSFATTEAAKTAAAAAGESARLAVKTAGLAAGSAQDVAAGSAQILNDAYKAAAGTYQSVSQIPYVGWILAPAAAAVAFGAVAAFDTLSSFDVGTNYVPRDMIAQVHAGERIIPRADNAALIGAMRGASGTAGAGNSPATHNWNYSPTIHAREPVHWETELQRSGDVFLDFIRRSVRYGKLKIT